MEGWPGVVGGPTADSTAEDSLIGDPSVNKREQGSIATGSNASGADIAPWLVDDGVSHSSRPYLSAQDRMTDFILSIVILTVQFKDILL